MEMTGNRKLRLLVTTECPNKCPMCCNNSWDFSKLPVVKHFDYDEIMITGGEPLLFEGKLSNLIISIKGIHPILYPGEQAPKIYVYTSRCSMYGLFNIWLADGFVLTPHNKQDVEFFIQFNDFLLNSKIKEDRQKSYRLNLFKDIKEMLPEDINLSLWKVKDMEWIKDCPVPEGEDFRRLPELWTQNK